MNNTTPKRIALIGGAGFIGHNIALELKKRGHDVHVVDSLFINNLLYFSCKNATFRISFTYNQLFTWESHNGYKGLD